MLEGSSGVPRLQEKLFGLIDQQGLNNVLEGYIG